MKGHFFSKTEFLKTFSSSLNKYSMHFYIQIYKILLKGEKKEKRGGVFTVLLTTRKKEKCACKSNGEVTKTVLFINTFC